MAVDGELAGLKVMVIDDSNTIRRSAEIFLGQVGCTVLLAEDGFDALGKIVEHEPDLVLHGHAHAGTFEGRIGNVPVYNVSVPVLGRDFWVFELSGVERATTPIH